MLLVISLPLALILPMMMPNRPRLQATFNLNSGDQNGYKERESLCLRIRSTALRIPKVPCRGEIILYTEGQSSASESGNFVQAPIPKFKREFFVTSSLYFLTFLQKYFNSLACHVECALEVRNYLADAIWARLPSDPTGPKGEVQHVLYGGALLHWILWPQGFPTCREICDMYCQYVMRKYGAVICFSA